MARNLEGKTLIVTGASSGIGAATAKRAAQAGMAVALGARRRDRLEALAEAIEQAGGQACVCVGDVGRDEDVSRLVETAWKAFGRVDAIFANAGYGRCVDVEAMADADVRAMFETNFHGTLRLIRAAAPRMRQTGVGEEGTPGLRHVVICSSAASLIGMPGYGVYSATKAAQHAIADALRVELEREGFKVSSVHPIGTRTEFFDHATQGAGRGLNTPEAFMQSPERVARLIVRALRRPRSEVWPSTVSRLALCAGRAFSPLGDRLARQIAVRRERSD